MIAGFSCEFTSFHDERRERSISPQIKPCFFFGFLLPIAR
ncbi:Uncharacterised protein [Vibrio cholerae]|nr:Uncharacterised protein [Vibrio cholerae]